MIKLIKNLGKQYFNNMKNQPDRITAGITNKGIITINKGVNRYNENRVFSQALSLVGRIYCRLLKQPWNRFLQNQSC